MTFFLRRRKPDLERDGENALLNFALHLAQEWGTDWMQPIQQRLGKAFPQLENDELDRLNNLAQNAMKYCYNTALEMYEKTNGEISREEWNRICLSKYPWIDEKNLTDLLATGRYYAWKDRGF